MGLAAARLCRRWCSFAAALCLCACACHCHRGASAAPRATNALRRAAAPAWHGNNAAANASKLTPSLDVADDAPPNESSPGVAARSLRCFEDGQVYSCCEGAYRLNPSGVVAVPLGAVDYYCDGECVVETEDVLNCVASALDGFRFYNGASVEDVRYALRRGCSHTARRGDFNDLEPHIGDYPDIYGDYGGDGSKATAPLKLIAFLGGVCLLVLGR